MATSGPKVSNALTRIRDAVGDAIPDGNGDYTWPDVHLFRWMTDARAELVSSHPEAGYVESVTRPTFTEIASAGEYLGIDRHYLGDLVELTVSKLMIEQSQDGANLAMANDQLKKVGLTR